MKEKLKILHIEDLKSDAEIVHRCLKKANLDCEVNVIDTKKQYLEALKEFNPDVILCDHSMPQFDSSDAIELFKLEKLNIPFILVTGTVSEEFAVKCLKMGADDYILKSNLTRLPDAIKQSIQNKTVENERDELVVKLNIKINDLNTFFYKASHDLKGPLSSMAGLINVASKDVSDQKSLRYFEMLKECSDKLNTILHNLIEVTQITQGIPAKENIDFKKLITETFNSLKYIENSSNMLFKFDVKLSEEFYGDSKLFCSVLQNLIHNSINYRKIDDKESYVSVRVWDETHYIFLQVEDNGEGIDEDQQEKVFEMFYRANYSSKGSGLGLYIVRTILEKVNGKIKLESVKNKGTTFTIAFPKSMNK